MSVTFSDAYKEALVCVPQGSVPVDTLSIEHPDQDPIFIVKDHIPFTATLDGDPKLGALASTEVVFQAGSFALTLPSKNGEGVPEFNLTIGNSDGVVTAYLEAIKLSQKALEVVYRPYLSDDTSGPAMDPPLRLQVKNVKAGRFRATARAVFARDLKNTMVPHQRYTNYRFPSLANGQ